MRAAVRSHNRAEQLHRDHRGEQGGAAGPTVAFAVTAGSLPPGLSLSPSSGSGAAITGNPTKAGTFSFTIKATDGGLTSTLAYEITITVQGPPDQLLCDPADNGGFLISGVCVLPDAVIGLPYQGHLVTSHKAGGTLSVVSGSLPPGLSLPATFTGSGDTIGGTPATPGVEPDTPSPCKAPATRASPCTRSTRSRWTRTQPLAINLPAGGSTLSPGTVGGAYRAELLPQRRGGALRLVPGLRAAPARSEPADVRRPA